MIRRDIDDAATVMTLLHRTGRSTGLRSLVSGWDMLQADVPDRERMETAWSILVGSGLAEVDSAWCLSLTGEGGRLRGAVRSRGGMRTIQAEIAGRLAHCHLAGTSLHLPPEAFDRAVRAYRGSAGHTMSGRKQRWWWPAPSVAPSTSRAERTHVVAERIDVIAHGLRQLGHPETAVVFTRLAEQARNTPSRAQRKVVKRELARLLQAGSGQISDQCPGSPQDSREYRDAVVWLQTYARSWW